MNFRSTSWTDLKLFAAPLADRWRGLRKVAQALLASTVVKHYLPLQEAESTQLVFDLLNTPDVRSNHLGRPKSITYRQ